MEETELGLKMIKYSLILQKPDVTENERVKIRERCIKYLTRVNENLNKLINMFNELVLDIAKMIYKLHPTKMNKIYLTMLENKINGDDKSTPLTSFLNSVYSNSVYKEHLISGNDSFFLNMEIDDEPKIIVKLKEYWSELPQPHKKYVIETVRTLVNIVDKYVEFKNEGNKILPVLAKV